MRRVSRICILSVASAFFTAPAFAVAPNIPESRLETCPSLFRELLEFLTPASLGRGPTGPASLEVKIGSKIQHSDFGLKMWTASEELSGKLKSTTPPSLIESLNLLAGARQKIASESKDPDFEAFGLWRREGSRFETPSSGKYDESLFLGQMYAVKAKNWPLRKTMMIGDEKIRLTSVAFDAEAGKLTWHHMPTRDMYVVVNHTQALYGEVLRGGLPKAEIIKKVAEIHWWLTQAMPFERGSAAIADAMTKAILHSQGISVGPWKKGVTADIVAFLNTPDRFVEIYPDLFEK